MPARRQPGGGRESDATTGGRILVLDGDDELGALVVDVAADAGMDARVTTAFADFLAKLEAWRPEQVMLDLAFDEVDGIEVVRHLAARGFDGHVVLSSSLDERVLDAARRSTREHGLAVSTLRRPLDRARLLDVLSGRSSGALACGAVARSSAAEIEEVEWLGVDAADLAEAIAGGDLFVAYQPNIDCGTGVPFAFEALARWHHARHGEVPPQTFVPIAERAGLVEELTESVFRQALAWFGRHFAGTSLNLCLNLSARSLADVGLADRIETLCEDAGVDTSQVVLELTETSSATDPTTARDLLTRLRIKGLWLALDDFGSGHSSLVQLARQPFSEIKIDRSFVRSVAESTDARSIVRAIVGLGYSLDLRVIAEGVEDEAAFDAVAELGCTLMQGDYIGPAMPGDEALEWLEMRAPMLRATAHRRAV